LLGIELELCVIDVRRFDIFTMGSMYLSFFENRNIGTLTFVRAWEYDGGSEWHCGIPWPRSCPEQWSDYPPAT